MLSDRARRRRRRVECEYYESINNVWRAFKLRRAVVEDRPLFRNRLITYKGVVCFEVCTLCR